MANEKYKPIIGLEVHVELKTKSKMFCGCSADLWRVLTSQQGSSQSEGSYFGPAEPNTHVCPVCLGLPGALPVPNKKASEWCVMIGLVLNCEIPLLSKFDRKNYFYPDLAKGYQISQYDQPFCVNGYIDLKYEIRNTKYETNSKSEIQKEKRIRIRRVHMEEDTAKLTHAMVDGENISLIDFNRSGVPLVEIVTEPDFESADEVVEYLKKLQQIVRYLGVSNADMEKGDMRLEPNISLMSLRGSDSDRGNLPGKIATPSARDDKKELPKYKVEVKNINSFRFVEKAIEYEIKRQSEILERGEVPIQETRGYNEAKNATISQRSKEEAHDYRYFPEPDIPPIRWTEDQISNIKNQIGELPWDKLERFWKEYGLSDYDSEILTREKETADYFEQAVTVGREHNVTAKQIANTIINKKIDLQAVLPAELIKSIVATTETVAIDQDALELIIKKILEEQKQAVLDFRNGKGSAVMFLVGSVMRNAKQKIDAQLVRKKLLKILNS